MTPVAFPQSNHTFQKEGCVDMPIYGALVNGSPVMVVCLQLSKEELEEVNETGVVWLQVHNEFMPAIAMGSKNPFNNEERTH